MKYLPWRYKNFKNYHQSSCYISQYYKIFFAMYFYAYIHQKYGRHMDPLTTTHHLHLHSTSIIHLHSHPTPFCHISTERITDGADILLKGEAKIHQEIGEAIWARCGASLPHHQADWPAAAPSINPTPSLLLSACNTTQFQLPSLEFHFKISQSNLF